VTATAEMFTVGRRTD